MLSRLLTVVLLIWAPALFGDRDSWLGSTYKVALSLSMLPSAKGDIPKPKNIGTPEYPADMMMATIDGQVVVEFTVDRKGAVTAVDILKSGGEDFEKSVKAAAKAWRFYPARNESNGKTISVRMRCTVTFSCPEDDAPNHAPDPTASAVTPAADAPVAPAIGRGSS